MHGVFEWTQANRYPQANALRVYKIESAAQRLADKLNAENRPTKEGRGWVVRKIYS